VQTSPAVAPAASPTPLAPSEGLRDIALPEPVSWMPPAPGWFVLAVLLLALAFQALRRHRARRAANLYRRQALGELDAIVASLAQKGGRYELAARLPELLKRVALHVEPRASVAALTGDAWLALLDRMYRGNEFRQGAGKILPLLTYASPAVLARVQRVEIDALVRLCREWIRGHHPVPTEPSAAGTGEKAA
jgi:hypothetical protein